MTVAIRRRARSRRLAVAVVGALAAGTALVASGAAGAVHDDNYETNGLSRVISGSPAQIMFTVQAD